MTPKEYVEQVLLTESDPAAAARRWDEHLRWSTAAILSDLADDAAAADQAKRVLFYGVSRPKKELRQIQLPAVLDRSTARLLHAVLGIASEAGELVSCSAWSGRDRTVWLEELGDLFWYIALACDELGLDFEQIWEANIAKLRARYPEGFSSARAEFRNLELERQALESQNPGGNR